MGLAVSNDSEANLVPINSADDWLHLALAVGMLAGGLLLTRREPQVAYQAADHEVAPSRDER